MLAPLAIAFLASICLLVQPTINPPSKDPMPAPSPTAVTPEFHEGTQERHERFNAISKQGAAQLVFLGDSITQGWEVEGKAAWEANYEKRHAANFGVSGDRTEHVLWRLDHGNFDGLRPKLIVVMIGTNNTSQRMDKAEDTAAGIRAILNRLEVKCPGSKVLLLAIFPRGEKADDPGRQRNQQVNALIARFADDKRVYFKDIGGAFLNADGTLKKNLMPDTVHPSSSGYDTWAEAIEGDVAKLMAD